MKGQLNNDTIQLLLELHNNRKFEIFFAFEGVPKDKSQGRTLAVQLEESDRDTDNTISMHLQKMNDDRRGIWFTADSMESGKRAVKNIISFNAIGLDLDSGKEGKNDR